MSDPLRAMISKLEKQALTQSQIPPFGSKRLSYERNCYNGPPHKTFNLARLSLDNTARFSMDYNPQEGEPSDREIYDRLRASFQ